MKIGELFFEISADSKKFTASMSEAKKSTLLFAGEVTAGLYALDRFVERSTNSATSMENMARVAGTSAAKLAALGSAINLTNPAIGIEKASAALANLGMNLTKLQQGRGNTALHNYLGTVSPDLNFTFAKLTFEQYIDKLSDSLQRMNKRFGAHQVALTMEQGGIPPELYDFFMKTKGERDTLGAKIALTDKEREDLKEADEAIARIKNNIGKIADKIVGGATGFLKGIADSLDSAPKDESVYKDREDALKKREDARKANGLPPLVPPLFDWARQPQADSKTATPVTLENTDGSALGAPIAATGEDAWPTIYKYGNVDKSVNISNNYTIHGTDAEKTAARIVDMQGNQINQAYQKQNLGSY